MELIAIIALFWLIGCAFPSSGQSHVPSGREVLTFVACISLSLGLFFAYWYTFVGIVLAGRWLDANDAATLLFAMFGPIAIPMLIAGLVNARVEQQRGVK
jgi:hypothetical protein